MDSTKSNLARIIQFDVHEDLYGTMVVADDKLPFKPQRNIWIYDMNEGRGKKAQRKCEQIYVVLQGAITVNVFDGTWREFRLDNSYEGLYLPPMTWREIKEIAFGTILLVMCSLPYIPEDRVDNFKDILEHYMSLGIAGKGLKFADEETN